MLAFIIALPISFLLIRLYENLKSQPEMNGENFAVGDKLIFKAGVNTGKKCTFLDASLFEFTVVLEDNKIIKCQEWEVTHDHAA